MERRRYQVLDTIRGCALVSMILYHTSWDLVYLFGRVSAGPSSCSPATASRWAAISSGGE